jgi:hypothetical protein
VTPPDPSREADEETEAEKAGKVEPELATAGDIEVEVGKRWWRRAAVIVFALLGWLVAFLPLLASR